MLTTDASSDAIGKFIAEKERLRKDRTTCLESQSRDFSGILTVLKDIQVCINIRVFILIIFNFLDP